MPVIGFLTSTPPELFAHMIDAFRAGLGELDYAEGRNVAFEYRTAWGNTSVFNQWLRNSFAARFQSYSQLAALLLH
jgi:hypothetical protein